MTNPSFGRLEDKSGVWLPSNGLAGRRPLRTGRSRWTTHISILSRHPERSLGPNDTLTLLPGRSPCTLRLLYQGSNLHLQHTMTLPADKLHLLMTHHAIRAITPDMFRDLNHQAGSTATEPAGKGHTPVSRSYGTMCAHSLASERATTAITGSVSLILNTSCGIPGSI